MSIKRRNKVSAEFSMSSLTDIIFLLLIFFMLTATLVKIQPFDLPESDSKTVAAVSAVVSIDAKGEILLDGEASNFRNMEAVMRKKFADMPDRENATVTIVAEKGVPFQQVIQVMEIAARLRVRAIIATQPPKKS